VAVSTAGVQKPLESEQDAMSAFTAWLAKFAALLERSALDQLSTVFAKPCYWKDILAFSWAHRTYSGLERIREAFGNHLPSVRPNGFRISPQRTLPRLVRRSGKAVVEAYFDFDTSIGTGTGFVRLLFDEAHPETSKAWILLTTLQQLAGFEETVGANRPSGIEYSTNFAGDNWLDKRKRSIGYEDRDPEVLVVGGAQAGLIIAARLRQRGVDTLIVEQSPRVGDVWRNRYHSLTLHNEVWANSMPYMPFPPSWPTFIPKDKLAGWLEAYAEAMELNVWTSTQFVGATYDAANRLWSARLKRADGTERTMRVPQLVLATGALAGVPQLPRLPGLESFSGEVIHSSAFTSGLAYRGKQTIVVGAGTSAHDVAQDLHSNGAASVTMMQRSPTCVVSLVPSGTMVYSVYGEGPPPEDIDLVTAAIPYSVLRETYQWLTKKTCELDKALIDSLQAVGFETAYGEDNTGFHMMYLRKGGGYYLNVGCSDLIGSRQIQVMQHRNFERFVKNGMQLKDGSIIAADLVVLATGYTNQQDGVRRLLGDEVADRVGPIWGFDENHSMRNMWQRTPQDRLWIMGGSLIDARLNSTFLALEIIADLHGIKYRKPGAV
jgi:pyridine nucleotide-disulfide oxidoreductase